MPGPFKMWMGVVVWLLIAAFFGLGWALDKITLGTLTFLELLVLILGAVAIVFWRKMANPPESVEQLLHDTDQSTRT